MSGVTVRNLENELVPTPGASAQNLAMDGSAKQLGALNSLSTHVRFTINGGNIRVTFDGSTPDATTGHLMLDGSSGTWKKETAQAAKFHGTAGAYFYASEFTR